jgi:hypothetical protein
MTEKTLSTQYDNNLAESSKRILFISLLVLSIAITLYDIQILTSAIFGN